MKTYKVETYQDCGFNVYTSDREHFEIISKHYGCHSYHWSSPLENGVCIHLQYLFYGGFAPEQNYVSQHEMVGNLI